MRKTQLPGEIIGMILSKTKNKPSVTHEFKNLFTKKDIKNITLSCNDVIKNGNMEELNKIKKLGLKCSNEDVSLAAHHGNDKVVKWILKNYPDVNFSTSDLVSSMDNDKKFNILYKNTSGSGYIEFNVLITAAIKKHNKNILKFLVDSGRGVDIGLVSVNLLLDGLNNCDMRYYTRLTNAGYKFSRSDLDFLSNCL